MGDALYEGHLENSNLYNDKELFEDGDLNWYDYGFRSYDAQIGRFPQLDPLTDDYPHYTPFQYAGNEPIANVDIDGLEPGTVLIGGVAHGIVGTGGSLFGGIGSALSSAATALTGLGVSIGLNAAKVSTEIYKYAEEDRLINKALEKKIRIPGPGVAGTALLTITAVLYPSDAIKGGDLSELQLYKQRQYYGEYTGHSNRKDNPNEHIVYELYGETFSGQKVLLKYGISDYTKYKEQRPRSQTGLDYINKVLPVAQKGLYKEITYGIRKFPNRASALTEEIKLVSQFYWRNNRMPYLQKRPAPMSPPGEW